MYHVTGAEKLFVLGRIANSYVNAKDANTQQREQLLCTGPVKYFVTFSAGNNTSFFISTQFKS